MTNQVMQCMQGIPSLYFIRSCTSLLHRDYRDLREYHGWHIVAVPIRGRDDLLNGSSERICSARKENGTDFKTARFSRL